MKTAKKAAVGFAISSPIERWGPRPADELRLFGLGLIAILSLVAQASQAGSATWNANPTNGEWTNASNWTPATVPNGPADVATFNTSSITNLSIATPIQVDRIVFNTGASAFQFTANSLSQLTLGGEGIMNNSTAIQKFITAVDTSGHHGVILFTNSAAAGDLGVFTNNGATVSGGSGGVIMFENTASAGNCIFTSYGGAVSGATGGGVSFHDSSTAGAATFVTNSGVVTGAIAASTIFYENSTAGNGVFITNGAPASGASRGLTAFYDNSSADQASLTANGATADGGHGGLTLFFDNSSADNSTLTATGGVGDGPLAGGTILFFNDSLGGTTRVKVFDNGYLDLNGHDLPGPAIGSLEGNGDVFLGADNLSVGTNNSNRVFSGVLHDGDSVPGGRSGGALTKVGPSKLVLTNANAHIGGTTITDGQLIVNNETGSGTGTGPVLVNGGRLGGIGTIGDAVTVGTGSGTGAILAPGKNSATPGTLTIQKGLVFNGDATYKFTLNSRRLASSKVVANGVTINSNAFFSSTDISNKALPPGTIITVIDNTAATPIAGTFSNLADNSTVRIGRNTFQVSYGGGDGNDLTLTVTP